MIWGTQIKNETIKQNKTIDIKAYIKFTSGRMGHIFAVSGYQLLLPIIKEIYLSVFCLYPEEEREITLSVPNIPQKKQKCINNSIQSYNSVILQIFSLFVKKFHTKSILILRERQREKSVFTTCAEKNQIKIHKCKNWNPHIPIFEIRLLLIPIVTEEIKVN